MSIYIDEFEKIYSTKSNFDGLRAKILRFAMQGKLTKNKKSQGNGFELLEKIKVYNKSNFNIKEKGIKSIEDFENSEIPYEIPSHWCWVTLNELAFLRRGASPRPITEFITNNENGVNWIKIGDATKGGKYITSVREKVTPQGAEKSVFLHKGSLVMSNSMSFGKAYILGIDGCIHDGWLSFSYNEELIIPELFQFFLNGSYDLFLEKAVGTGVKNLNIDRVKTIPFPLPPIEEQKLIVNAIEGYYKMIDQLESQFKKKELLQKQLPQSVVDAIGACETAHQLKEQLEFVVQNFEEIFQTPESMQDLRNVILQLAIEGKLVPQDSSDEPASVLLEKIKAEKEQLIKAKKIKKSVILEPISEDEIPFEIPKSWEWVRLDDFVDVRDGTHDSPKYVTNGYPLVTSKNISSGKIDLDNTKNISKIDFDTINERSKVDVDDILFAMIGTVGNPVVIKDEPNYAVKNVAIFKTNIYKKINSEYLLNFLLVAQKNMNSVSSGGVQKFVSLSYLRNYLLPIPPESEQVKINSKIKSIMLNIDQMEEKLKKRDQIIELLGSS